MYILVIIVIIALLVYMGSKQVAMYPKRKMDGEESDAQKRAFAPSPNQSVREMRLQYFQQQPSPVVQPTQVHDPSQNQELRNLRVQYFQSLNK